MIKLKNNSVELTYKENDKFIVIFDKRNMKFIVESCETGKISIFGCCEFLKEFPSEMQNKIVNLTKGVE